MTPREIAMIREFRKHFTPPAATVVYRNELPNRVTIRAVKTEREIIAERINL